MRNRPISLLFILSLTESDLAKPTQRAEAGNKYCSNRTNVEVIINCPAAKIFRLIAAEMRR